MTDATTAPGKGDGADPEDGALVPLDTADDRPAISAEPTKAEKFSRGYEPVTFAEWLMVTLAVVNILMLLARDAYQDSLSLLTERIVIYIDLGILALFALEFLARLFRSSDRVGYVRSHWYDLVGMVPIAHVGFRSFRLVRLLRMYTVAHFPIERVKSRSWDMALFRGVIAHYRSVLVEEISDPLLLSWLDTVEGPLVRARFAENIGQSLEDKRPDLRKAAREAIESSRGFKPFMRFEKGRELVDHVTDSVMDSLVAMLESEELNAVLEDGIHEMFRELKAELGKREYRERGGGLFRPVAH